MAKSDISFSMTLDSAAFAKGMAAAQNAATQSAKAIQSVMLKAAGVLAVAFGAKTFADSIFGAIETGKQIDMLARTSGLAAGDITLMTHALDRSGQTAESTTEILSGLRDSIRDAAAGGQEARLKFQTMGLDIEKLSKMSPSDAFVEIAGAVNSIGDASYRSRVAVSMLGEAGGKAALMFKGEDLKRAFANLGGNAAAMEKSAKDMARIHDALNRLKETWGAFFERIIAKVAPVISQWADSAESVIPKILAKADEVGDAIARWIKILHEAFETGAWKNLLVTGIELAGLKLFNYISKAVSAFTMGLGEAIGQISAVLSKGEFWAGLGNVFVSLGNLLGDSLLSAFQSPITNLQAAFELITDKMANVINQIIYDFQMAWAMITGKKTDFKKTFVPREEDFDAIVKKTKPLFAGKSKSELEADAKTYGTSGIAQIAHALKGTADLKALTNQIVKGWQEGGGIMTEEQEALQSKWNGIIMSLEELSKINEAEAEDKKTKAATETTRSPAKLFAMTAFDQLQRIGAGAGKAVGAVTTAERQLSVQEKMRDHLGRIEKFLGGGPGARFSNPTGGMVLAGAP